MARPNLKQFGPVIGCILIVFTQITNMYIGFPIFDSDSHPSDDSDEIMLNEVWSEVVRQSLTGTMTTDFRGSYPTTSLISSDDHLFMGGSIIPYEKDNYSHLHPNPANTTENLIIDAWPKEALFTDSHDGYIVQVNSSGEIVNMLPISSRYIDFVSDIAIEDGGTSIIATVNVCIPVNSTSRYNFLGGYIPGTDINFTSCTLQIGGETVVLKDVSHSNSIILRWNTVTGDIDWRYFKSDSLEQLSETKILQNGDVTLSGSGYRPLELLCNGSVNNNLSEDKIYPFVARLTKEFELLSVWYDIDAITVLGGVPGYYGEPYLTSGWVNSYKGALFSYSHRDIVSINSCGETSFGEYSTVAGQNNLSIITWSEDDMNSSWSLSQSNWTYSGNIVSRTISGTTPPELHRIQVIDSEIYLSLSWSCSTNSYHDPEAAVVLLMNKSSEDIVSMCGGSPGFKDRGRGVLKIDGNLYWYGEVFGGTADPVLAKFGDIVFQISVKSEQGSGIRGSERFLIQIDRGNFVKGIRWGGFGDDKLEESVEFRGMLATIGVYSDPFNAKLQLYEIQ